MSKELTTTDSLKLPTHLAAILQKKPEAANVGDGLTGATPVIRVAGTQKQIAIDDGTITKTSSVDIIIVGVNPNQSITVFEGKYDPKKEPTPPVFTSDDGTPVPAQFLSCNVIKSRRFAVLRADNPSAGLYELRVPFASILDADAWVSKVRKTGVPIFGVVTTIGFSEEYDYPRFAFTSQSFVNAEQAEYVEKYLNSQDVTSVLRLNQPAKTFEKKEEKVAGEIKPAIAAAPKKSAAAKVITNPQPVEDEDLKQTLANILGA